MVGGRGGLKACGGARTSPPRQPWATLPFGPLLCRVHARKRAREPRTSRCPRAAQTQKEGRGGQAPRLQGVHSERGGGGGGLGRAHVCVCAEGRDAVGVARGEAASRVARSQDPPPATYKRAPPHPPDPTPPSPRAHTPPGARRRRPHKRAQGGERGRSQRQRRAVGSRGARRGDAARSPRRQRPGSGRHAAQQCHTGSVDTAAARARRLGGHLGGAEAHVQRGGAHGGWLGTLHGSPRSEMVSTRGGESAQEAA